MIEFLASMSHELRTPLNAILGFAQLLQGDKKEPLSQRHRERVDRIVAGGEQLRRLLEDILDLAQLEAGRVSLSIEPTDVSEVAFEVRSILESAATLAGVEVEMAPVPKALPPVAADRARLLQMVMNLATNAIRYNRRGGKVTFALSLQTEGRVRITVSDTGNGISLEEQEMLFHPSHRGGKAGGGMGGTGVGLVITKRLAELMQGEVGFRSTQGVGSDFWIDLPPHAVSPA